MAKKTEAKPNDTKAKKLDALGEQYYEGNQIKNRGATMERNAVKDLEKEMADYGETHVTKISDHVYLEMGYMNIEGEEIDPKKFLEKYPDMFWDLVSVPITAVKASLGDKEAALMTRPVKKNQFKVVKHKTDPRK